jgi:mannosyl-3-phosphoglycerate synthase
MEVEAVRQLGRFMDKRMMIVHQQDSGFAEVFKKSWLHLILDFEEGMTAGKVEGMVMGLLIAKVYHKDYLAFIDGDNYVPGARMSTSRYLQLALACQKHATATWGCRGSKPKVRTKSLQFSKLGSVSETANKNVNSLLSSITGFETEVINTGYSGEHVLSTPVTECLHYSTGHSIEHYEFIEIFKKFGGLVPSEHLQIMESGVEIF